jgi:hypothetical protein
MSDVSTGRGKRCRALNATATHRRALLSQFTLCETFQPVRDAHQERNAFKARGIIWRRRQSQDVGAIAFGGIAPMARPTIDERKDGRRRSSSTPARG